MKKDNKGFSLVELIIVIAIMAVLVGVLAPQFIRYVESSRQSTDIQSVAEYKTAVETYVADKGAVSTLTSNITITASSSGVYASVPLSDVGLATGASDATPFKSNGWGSFTATYDVSNYKWNSVAATAGTNSKAPSKALGAAFN